MWSTGASSSVCRCLPFARSWACSLSLLGDRRAVSSDELVTAVLARFSASEGDSEYLEHWVDTAVDAVLDHDPSFMMIPPDLVVHVPTILDGAVLTHRLTDSERSEDCIRAGADLAALLHRSDRLQLESGGEVEARATRRRRCHGRPRRLAGRFRHRDVARLSARREHLVDLDGGGVRTAPGCVTDAARAAYDRGVDQPWLPVGADEIVVGMVLENPGILATPIVPFSELLTHAGLEQRGIEFAHDDSVWRAAKTLAPCTRFSNASTRVDAGGRPMRSRHSTHPRVRPPPSTMHWWLSEITGSSRSSPICFSTSMTTWTSWTRSPPSPWTSSAPPGVRGRELRPGG